MVLNWESPSLIPIAQTLRSACALGGGFRLSRSENLLAEVGESRRGMGVLVRPRAQPLEISSL